jgi:predicted nucleic acid-binding protein
MPASKAFFDTNVLIYAFAANDRRQGVALDLLMAGGTIGVQTLNEFVRVSAGKMQMPWPDVILSLRTIELLCPQAVPLSMEVHRRGLSIAQAYGYGIYDSLMLAAALEASCTIFCSEDLRHGQSIGTLTIRNPFA